MRPEQPAGLVADPRHEPVAPFRVDLQAGFRQVLGDPLAHLASGARVDLGAAHPHDGLQERLGHASGPPLEHEQRGREGVDEVVDERLDQIVALPLLGHPTEDHSVLGQERRRLGRVDQREERIALVARRTDVDLLHHEGPVLVTDQIVDEQPDGVAQHHLVVTAQERHRDGAHAPRSARAARTAAMTSAVRRAPRTSWARRIRHPSAMPRAWAACDASRRSSTSVPTRSPRNRLFDADRNKRPAERGQPVVGPQELERLGLGLAEIEARVDHHPLARDPRRLGGLRPGRAGSGTPRRRPARRRRDRDRGRAGRSGCGSRRRTHPPAPPWTGSRGRRSR